MKRKIKYEEENKKTKRNLKKETIINDDKYKRYNNKKLNVEILQTEKGITLLVLVVTIIVLLILAGITIGALTGENGIIKNARESKEQTEIANEKEILEKATVEAMGKNKYGNIEESELQSELDKETGEGKTETVETGEEFEVLFKESNRYYTVDKDGNIEEVNEYYQDKNPGDITVGKDGEKLDGSEDHPYEIWCIEDLLAFSNMVSGEGIRLENGKPVEITTANSFTGKYVNLKANLNFKSKLSYQNSERTDFGDINGNTEDGNSLMNEMTTGTGFKPIGINNAFTGIFEGQNKETQENYKISNLYINYENDTVLNGYGFGRPIGLFAKGNTQDTTIKNLEISGEIKGAGHTGSIIGENAKLLENCINHANIIGYNMVGGIAGYNIESIKSSENYGEVNITGRSYRYGGAGGIIGNGSIVENCINEGNIFGNVTVGGIVGYNYSNSCKINYCKNYGNITLNGTSTQSAPGGILGVNALKVEIKNSCNQGTIIGKGTSEVPGGIVGASKGGANGDELILSIYNSFNTGEVISENNMAGGIVGRQGTVCAKNYIYIENCWSLGNASDFGGMIGTINNNSTNTETKTEINNSYYTSEKAIEKMDKENDENIVNNAIQKTEKEIYTQQFVDLLNSYTGEGESYPVDWKIWKLGEDGYPTFQ